MEAWHIEDNPVDPGFSFMKIFLHYIKGFHLCQVLLDVHLDKYPLLTQCLDKCVKIWMWPNDDGLKPSMPSL